MVEANHLAPSCPDTTCTITLLDCQPFTESDPFVISNTPDIFVIGCRSRSCASIYTSSLCFLVKNENCIAAEISRFVEKSEILTIDTKTLSALKLFIK